ncbi:uncharacterized membrane-associated protein [Cenarchaeum symbiosum A]|uniref:Uncharacterized membrane-associated protein n=1 Tax=Cenarchaeum symbiosum (strain A) TaxID=414004 RepID=A0RYS9_CENSY|nr:uncharacterized membrane-associated protein [Cenarchaeum symbiosum A]
MAIAEGVGPEGMLFVRIDAAFGMMIRASLFVAGMLIVAAAAPVQSLGLVRGLDLTVYPDGLTHVEALLEADPQQPELAASLFGSSIDNFVATGGSGHLLETRITGDGAVIETLGASSVSLEYDIHDLVSKEGRIWSFSLDAPAAYTLLMPEGTVIVGMSRLPASMDAAGGQSLLSLPEGPVRIDYIFAASAAGPQPVPVEPAADIVLPLAVAAAAAAAAAGGILYMRRRTSRVLAPIPDAPRSYMDPQAIFQIKPDLREDDRAIVSFIFRNGGRAMESEIRKRFLQPRTTMWRALKRLERNGIINIEKRDQQNVVTLTDSLEEEE